MNKYRDFFNIDENYFPSVNEDVINKGLVDWKKFYPHETFVKLLKDMESVLSRNQKLSIWVEGAYGTGKSHAALTLKKLLDASEEDTRAYFEKYDLSKDLLNKLQGDKSQGTLLTIHRYGSSDIRSDNDLIIAVQESIKKALVEKNFEFHCEETLKGAIIDWLSDELNKNYFNAQITKNYSMLFGTDDADSILDKLRTYNDKDVVGLIHKIFKVANEIGITALKLDVTGLIEWIRNVIKANNLKYIVFVWDEFNEYFDNNKNSLTGFQKLIELSATDPFCFVIITHKSEGLFNDKDEDKAKILGRFVRPTCNIELPENMAFRLMGAAMEKKPEETIRQEWDECADDLNGRLHDSRNLVMTSAGISESELKGILPIHPFTALMLKHLSSAFDSNQRSMFDFIKNNRGEDIKGFQWYIDKFGPYDAWPLLTIDMLWDFFYDNGKEHLDSRIRMILDSYNRQNSSELDDEQKRVFKAILLLQAISQKVGDTVELFIPNDRNIANAFDGTDLEAGRAVSIAERLVRNEVIFKRPTGSNKFEYSAMVNNGDTAAIERLKKELFSHKSTQDLVAEGNLLDVLNLSGGLKLRCVVKSATVDNIKRTVNELRNLESKYENNILAVVTFAKDESERSALIKIIHELISGDGQEIVFIDTSLSPFGSDGLEQYIINLANSSYQRGKDNGLANQFDSMAQDVLKKWKDKISNGEIVIFTKANSVGDRFFSLAEVHNKLKEINHSAFNLGLESYSVIGTMFDANSLASGAQCGATQIVSGTYRSTNPATKLENALEGAWQVERYWESNKGLLISKIKTDVEDEIKHAFDADGRISISQIYDKLKVAPYGFMPCNLTAFVLGFLLKEYAIDTYSWSDGTCSDQMSVGKLKEMIDEIIKIQNTPNGRYKEKYIVKMSDQERKFRTLTARVFNISENQCASIEDTGNRLRAKMKELTFPIWSVKEIISEYTLSVDCNVIVSLIDDFCGVANSANIHSQKTETEFALEIGKICVTNPTVVDDLVSLITKENCKKGMLVYLDRFEQGKLKALADQIGDNGEYINVLKDKFDADAAAWVWRNETVEKKIQEVILDYSLIEVSNRIITKTTSLKAMTQEWCDKLNFYKLAYDSIKNEIDDFKPLFELLAQVKKFGSISDNIKKQLVEQLEAKVDTFNSFWSKQQDMFKDKFSFQLNEMPEEQIEEVYKKIAHVFTKTNAEYMQYVGELINEFKKNLGKTKLRTLWYEKTATRTPRDWSTTFTTPILCMIETDYDKAKYAFETINRNNPDDGAIKKALEFLQSSDIFERLADAELRDKCFIEKIVRNYSVMLTDISDARGVLSERLHCDIYDWYPNEETERIIKKYAEVKYNECGCNMALQRIEDMEPDKLKTYLKQLIRENMTVGMEIINDK